MRRPHTMFLGLVLCLTLSSIATPPRSGAQETVTTVLQHIEGFVVATYENKVSTGEGDYVLIDRGSKHGVQVGDRFFVYSEEQRVAHPMTGRVVLLPSEAIGELVVVQVHEQTATVRVRYSTREVGIKAPVVSTHQVQVQIRQPAPRAAAPSATQVQTQMAQLMPCLESLRQQLREAESRGASSADTASTRLALSRSEMALEQAKTLLKAGDAERASYRLEGAATDCQTAQKRATMPTAVVIGAVMPVGR